MQAGNQKELTLCFGFNRPENKRLLNAWLQNKHWARIDLVGIRLWGEPISSKDLDFAIKSARRVPQSRLGRTLKRLFLRWQFHWVYAKLVRSNATQIFNYNGLKGVNYLVTVAARHLGLKLQFWEIAPLPNRIQIDSRGINFGSSVPRDPEFYRKLDPQQFPDTWRDAQLQLRTPHRKSKIQHQDAKGAELAEMHYVFCPLQVPTDSQITIFGDWISDLKVLVENLASLVHLLPLGFHIRLKEHPSSPISLTDHIRPFESDRLQLDNETNTLDLMRHSQCVLTVNSSAGLEAFHFEKPVITLGQAFYSFGELTTRAHNMEELAAALKTVDSLTFSASQRDQFLRFLYQWFPTRESIENGSFNETTLQARDKLISG